MSLQRAAAGLTRRFAKRAPARSYASDTVGLEPQVRLLQNSIEGPLFFTNAQGSVISPWHDIPLRRQGTRNIFNYVCEIPRGTRPKFEISTTAENNPIIQDTTKAGKPRFYGLDSIVNYGALPQTYEDPDHKDEWTGLLGDGDPIDVCDISTGRKVETGSVYGVKVVGALAMIDGGETDWKILAIRADDPLAAQVDDIAHKAPDAVLRVADDIRHWFRTYKIPEGKGENTFAFDGAWLGLDKTLEIIESTHKQYLRVLAQQQATARKQQYNGEPLAQAVKGGPWVPPLAPNAPLGLPRTDTLGKTAKF